jgi:hypothetical protein
VTGEKNSPTVAHACRKRRLNWVPGAWRYNWATQSPGDINMKTWSSRLGVGRGADDPTPEKVNSSEPKDVVSEQSDRLKMTGSGPLRRRRPALECRAI